MCANRVTNAPLPPGIDLINIPKLTVGSSEAIQTANAQPVSSTDITTSTVSGKVNTIAGQQDISIQLLEQSPVALDGVIWSDLTSAYDQQLDLQILTGSGANGQHQGILTLASQTSNTNNLDVNAVTVATATFHDQSTTGTQYRSIAAGANTVETNRFASATGIWCRPRRATSWNFASDTTDRPLFVNYGTFNAVGSSNGGAVAEGVAGEVHGLPVIKDANVPITMSGTTTTGGTADPIIVLKEDDLFLWESSLRLRALPEILSGTLQVRFQAFAYSCFIPSRFPPSISVLTGNTGLAAPTY